MDVRALQSKQLFAAVVVLASTVVLAMQLINPSPVVVSVGENGTEVAELGGYFRYPDVAVIAVAACLLGSGGTYLLVADRPAAAPAEVRRADVERAGETQTPLDEQGPEPSDDVLEARRQEWEETAERLANNERDIYETILEADGVLPQSDIVDRTDLSKATVSRELDSLETKQLVERKRRGMGNVVLLL